MESELKHAETMKFGSFELLKQIDEMHYSLKSMQIRKQNKHFDLNPKFKAKILLIPSGPTSATPTHGLQR